MLASVFITVVALIIVSGALSERARALTNRIIKKLGWK